MYSLGVLDATHGAAVVDAKDVTRLYGDLVGFRHVVGGGQVAGGLHNVLADELVSGERTF